MTPVTTTVSTVNNGQLTVLINDTGTTYSLVGDTVVADFAGLVISPTVSATLSATQASAEAARALENLTILQGYFETEMGAELLAYNSQALVKDSTTKVYTQAVTRIAFDSYQKGLDGHP